MKLSTVLFLDMDGVITDFDNRFKDFSGGLTPDQYKLQHGASGRDALYSKLPMNFWTDMNWATGGREIVNFSFLNFAVVCILTSTGTGNDWSRYEIVKNGKLQWILKNIPQLSKKQIIFVPYANLKAARYSEPNRILVDDKDTTISSWNKRGGYGVLHNSEQFKNSIEALQQYINTSK